MRFLPPPPPHVSSSPTSYPILAPNCRRRDSLLRLRSSPADSFHPNPRLKALDGLGEVVARTGSRIAGNTVATDEMLARRKSRGNSLGGG